MTCPTATYQAEDESTHTHTHSWRVPGGAARSFGSVEAAMDVKSRPLCGLRFRAFGGLGFLGFGGLGFSGLGFRGLGFRVSGVGV